MPMCQIWGETAYHYLSQFFLKHRIYQIEKNLSFNQGPHLLRRWLQQQDHLRAHSSTDLRDMGLLV